MKMNKHTLFKLLGLIDNKKYTHISKIIFYVLFNFKNETLIEMMIEMKPATSYIIQADCGDADIELYGIKFKKCGGNIY